jgi:hypothetical protein
VLEELKARFKTMPKLREPPPPAGSQQWPMIREILQAFTAHGVQFVIVGGYAVVFHGYDRYTGDVDLFVHPGPSNADAIVRAFQSLNFTHPELSVSALTRRSSVFRFGVRPEQTELLLDLKGVTWEDAWQNAIEHELMGVRVRFLDIENLIKSKEAAGRPRDWDDVEKLRQIQRDSWLG